MIKDVAQLQPSRDLRMVEPWLCRNVAMDLKR